MRPAIFKNFFRKRSRLIGGVFFIFVTAFLINGEVKSSFQQLGEVKGNKIKSGEINVYDLSAPASTANLVCELLNNKNYPGLYWVVSKDISETFEKESFVQSFKNGSIKICEIKEEAEYISNEWAKSTASITNNDGSGEEYIMVLKKEDQDWRFYGTSTN